MLIDTIRKPTTTSFIERPWAQNGGGTRAACHCNERDAAGGKAATGSVKLYDDNVR